MIVQPITPETVDKLTRLLDRDSQSLVLLLCDTEALRALAGPERPDAAGYEELLNAILRLTKEKALGQFPESESEASTVNLEKLLSPREMQVLGQLTLGSSDIQIAKVLSIAPNTVYTHVRHIKEKLRTSNRTQTALVAKSMFHPIQELTSY